jgi:hypothetical protein
MDDQTWNQIATRLAAGLPFRQENLATQAVAETVAANGATAIWTATDTPANLQELEARGSWTGVKTYDVAWSTSPNPAVPTRVVQVKHDNSGAESQKAVLFVGDVAFSALDSILHPGILFTVIGYYALAEATYWPLLAGAGSYTIFLDPVNAQEGNMRPDWIDPATKRMAPVTRTAYNRIFGAGTNAKFSGLWRRPGTLTIEAAVRTHKAAKSKYGLVAYTIKGATFGGAGDVQDWWP